MLDSLPASVAWYGVFAGRYGAPADFYDRLVEVYPRLADEDGPERLMRTMRFYATDIPDSAKRLGQSISMGRGKTDLLSVDLTYRLTFGCPYGKHRIHLDDAVVDHKCPIGAVRNRAASDAKREADRPANLHIICTRCNRIKGDMTDEQFRSLVAFFDSEPALRSKVERRLLQSASYYKNLWAGRKMRGFKRP